MDCTCVLGYSDAEGRSCKGWPLLTWVFALRNKLISPCMVRHGSCTSTSRVRLHSLSLGHEHEHSCSVDPRSYAILPCRSGVGHALF